MSESEDFETYSVKSYYKELNETMTREKKCRPSKDIGHCQFIMYSKQPAQSIGPSHSGVKSELLFDPKTSEEIEAPVQPNPASSQKKNRKTRSLAKQKTNPEATLNRCSDDSNKQQREISTSLSNLLVLSRELSTDRPAGNNVSRSEKNSKPTSRTQQKRYYKQNWSTQFMRKFIKQSDIALEEHSILKNDLSEELIFQILTKEEFYNFVKTRNSRKMMMSVWNPRKKKISVCKVDDDRKTSQRNYPSPLEMKIAIYYTFKKILKFLNKVHQSRSVEIVKRKSTKIKKIIEGEETEFTITEIEREKDVFTKNTFASLTDFKVKLEKSDLIVNPEEKKKHCRK